MEEDMDAEADLDVAVEKVVVGGAGGGAGGGGGEGDVMVEVGETMVTVPAGSAIGGAPAKQLGGFFPKTGAKKLEVPQSQVPGGEEQEEHTFYYRSRFRSLFQGMIDMLEEKWTWRSCLAVIIQHRLESLQKPKDLSLANARGHE
jgi:hypothetical protein